MMDRPEDGLERLRRKLLLVAVIVVAIAGLYWLVLPRQDSNEYATETLVSVPVESDDIIWYVGEWHGKYSYRGPCYAENYLIGMIAERKEYFGEINYVPLYVARGEKTILDGVTYTVKDIEGDYIILSR